MVRKLVVALVTALALVMGTSTVQAHAAPVTPQSQAPKPTWRYYKVSSTQYHFLRLAALTRYYNKRDRTLDYRIAIKRFRTSSSNHTKWRRHYAAGWLKAGGHIDHITAGELSRIKTIRRAHSVSPLVVQPMSPNCRGVTKVVKGTTTARYRITHYYMNSCKVNNLESFLGWCTGVAGFGTLIYGHILARVAMGYIALLCSGGISTISAAANNSSLGAVIVDARYVNYGPPTTASPLVETVYARVRPQ